MLQIKFFIPLVLPLGLSSVLAPTIPLKRTVSEMSLSSPSPMPSQQSMPALLSSPFWASRQFICLRNAWNSKLDVLQDRYYIDYSSDIGILVDVYPEFQNRLIEDIPYEE